MALAPEMIDLVKQALPGSGTWYDIYSRIIEVVPKGEEERHSSLVWAFGYHLITPDNVERREREGSAFGAWIEFEDGRIPPRLSDVSDEDVSTWLEAFDVIDDPRLRSRVGDLLWERKHQPRPDQKARAACVALLELAADVDWEPMESPLGLVRAFELANSLSDEALRERVVEAGYVPSVTCCSRWRDDSRRQAGTPISSTC